DDRDRRHDLGDVDEVQLGEEVRRRRGDEPEVDHQQDGDDEDGSLALPDENGAGALQQVQPAVARRLPRRRARASRPRALAGLAPSVPPGGAPHHLAGGPCHPAGGPMAGPACRPAGPAVERPDRLTVWNQYPARCADPEARAYAPASVRRLRSPEGYGWDRIAGSASAPWWTPRTCSSYSGRGRRCPW